MNKTFLALTHYMRKVWRDRFHCYECLLSMKRHEMYLIFLSLGAWNLTEKFHRLLKLILETTIALQYLTVHLTISMVSLYFTFQINFLRNKHKIHVQGTDLPDPITTFQQLEQEYKINSRLLQNILDAGFQVPTPIQMQAIPVMLHVSMKI